VESYAAHIAVGLNQLEGYEAIVLTSSERGYKTAVEVIDGVKVVRFPAWIKFSNTPMSPLWPWRIRRALADNEIDLVNVHMPVPFMAEAAAVVCGRRPLVVTYHAGSMVKNRRAADLVIRFYERRILPLILHRADAVVAVSRTAETRVLPDAGGKTFLVSPGVDGRMFAPADEPNAHYQEPVMLYVGRIERSSAWKGIDDLIEAFALVLQELPDSKLVLVGAGDAVSDHRRAVARLGIGASVRFNGALTGSALVEAYRRSSVVVLPSTTESESFGMTLIEAMACGKPVVASDVGGIPFVVDDGRDGLLVPPANPRELASACLRVLKDTEFAGTLGQHGRQKIERSYTWATRVDRYASIFSDITTNPPPLPDMSPAKSL